MDEFKMSTPFWIFVAARSAQCVIAITEMSLNISDLTFLLYFLIMAEQPELVELTSTKKQDLDFKSSLKGNRNGLKK